MRAAALAICILALVPAAAEARAKFLWGVANAGFQADMGPGAPNDENSDWWLWTHDPDNIAKKHVSGDQPEQSYAHWKNYALDFRIARKLKANSFRFSIEWSRIFPRSTAGANTIAELDALADQSALAHYRDYLTEMRKRRLTPFVTLNHFSLPKWIHDPIAARNAYAGIGPDDPPPSGYGAAGWMDPATPAEFAKYAGYVAAKFGKLVDYWVPQNEPNVVAIQGYLNIEGVFASWFPPGAGSFPSIIQALYGEARANAAAYDAIKKVDPTSKVGLVVQMLAWHPAGEGSAKDRRAAGHADYLFNRLVPNAYIRGEYDENADGVVEKHPELARKADFLGLNYYRPGEATGLDGPISKSIPLLDFIPKVEYTKKECPSTCSDLGWEIDPAGFRSMLKLSGSYKVPVYVTENGIADSRDRHRAKFIRDHVRVMRKAMKDRLADVRGYFHWTLEDNLEWSAGYAPKFGLITKSRRGRPSAKVFANLAPR